MDKYRIEYIPVCKLSVVWVGAQRPYDEKWAKSIADNFDPDKFDPLVVTLPNGQGIYHLVEGQHRRWALQMYAAKMDPVNNGQNEMAPCRVIDEADPARAAEIWLGINKGRKAIKPVHEFKVAVTAKRDIECDISKILHDVGYKVSLAKLDYHVSAVSALRLVYQRHGAVMLKKTLQALSALWGGDPQAVCSPMLRGFGIFVNEFDGHIVMKRLKAQIGERYTPWKFKEAAEARKTASAERLDEAIEEMLIKEYNRGLKGDGRLQHKHR